MSLVQIDQAKLSGKQYWRSLNELAGSSKFRSWVEQEFPGGAELLDSGSRRNVLKLMAASFGLAGLAACRRPEERILPHSKGVEDLVPGKPLHYNTVFVQGGHTVGLTVESHDGRPTKVEGNPNHPASQGAALAHAQASVLNVYDPDRAKEVLENGKASNWAAFDKFAAEQFTESKLGKGEGLRILSERVVSPSLMEVRKALLAKYPAAKWFEWEPVSDSNAFEGIKAVFGQPYQAHYHYDKADIVVTLDCDFLGMDAGSPAAIKRFSKKRRVEKPEDSINRLYSVESQFSMTGAAADHRLRMKSGDIDAFASNLARELGVVTDLAILKDTNDKVQKTLMAIKRDLEGHKGKSIVVAGPRQPVRVHMLAAMLNAALGNMGETVTLTQAVSVPAASAIADLAKDPGSALVILGGNPAYTAPADLDFAGVIKRAAVSVYLGFDVNETSMAAKWSLPEATYFEAWGDARAIDGTASIQQPLILPINGGRSALELAAQVAGYKDRKGYDIVRNYWTAQWPAPQREANWRKALHDGVIAGTEFAAVKAAAGKPALPPQSQAAPMEVVFVADASVYDGRFANNAWMQEAPDPMTKLTWDNAAFLSAATAKKLGAADGDMLTLQAGGKTLEIPAMIQPGHADDSITIPLGYGRKDVGRVGKGAGFNGYAIRTVAGMGFGAVDARKGSGTYQLVTTQEHHTMTEPFTGKERPIVRQATMEHYREEPEFAKEMVEAPDESIYGWWDYSKGYQWGMAIDLTSCIGCNACVVACQAENNIPVVGKVQVARSREMHWIRMDRYYTGPADDAEAVLQPLNCQQCENAPCESVCPVAATNHSPEGLNDMVYNRCVGTRYCANNCPYKVRRFNFLNYHNEMQEVEKGASNPDVTVRMRGIMEKCTYCVQRIQEKRILAKTEGRRAIREGEVVTACQQTCPADAIVFGNINDPASRVSQLKKQPRNYALLAEVNTRPRTTFLAKLRNPNPELAGKKAEKHG